MTLRTPMWCPCGKGMLYFQEPYGPTDSPLRVECRVCLSRFQLYQPAIDNMPQKIFEEDGTVWIGAAKIPVGSEAETEPVGAADTREGGE